MDQRGGKSQIEKWKILDELWEQREKLKNDFEKKNPKGFMF
jgi:Spy/CpxP family protein refolding chaperone